MPRRTYTPQQRNQAIDLYVTDGPTTVQTQLGIPKATVCNWARQAGVETVQDERTAAAVETHKLKWEELRVSLVHDMGRVAAKALERAEQEMAEGRGRDAQAFTTTMAILVDKAQLLSGEASMRVEHRHLDAMDAELEAMSAQLEARADE